MEDINRYMELVFRLALKGKGKVAPNPLVGAIVVKDGKILGRGSHLYFGAEHAEIAALKEAGKKCLGATLFCNLEPCVHFGKRPPCVPEIINAGIKKAVIAIEDPNPLNSGRGITALQKAGIEVFLGIGEERAKEINKEFIKEMREKECLPG